jgi:hypothetical protein
MVEDGQHPVIGVQPQFVMLVLHVWCERKVPPMKTEASAVVAAESRMRAGPAVVNMLQV